MKGQEQIKMWQHFTGELVLKWYIVVQRLEAEQTQHRNTWIEMIINHKKKIVPISWDAVGDVYV